MPDAIFEQAALGQSPHQEIEFLVGCATRRKRSQREAGAQSLRTFRDARAELPEPHRIAVEAGGNPPVRLRFKRDVAAKTGGNDGWRDPAPSFFSGSAQAGMPLRYGEGME